MFERINEFLTKPQPYVKPLIANGLLFPGSRMFIFGRYGTWKSMLAMYTAYCLSTGTPWFKLDTIKSKVALAQVEIPEAQYQKRLVKYFRDKDADASQLWVSNNSMLKARHPAECKVF